MKLISKLICGLGAIALASHVFATSCPPIETVKSLKFNYAVHDDSMDENQWGMLTNHFEFESKTWNVAFITLLPNVNNPIDAIHQGQERFKTVDLNQPQPNEWGDSLICIYNSAEDAFVVAKTPPIEPLTNLKKFRR